MCATSSCVMPRALRNERIAAASLGSGGSMGGTERETCLVLGGESRGQTPGISVLYAPRRWGWVREPIRSWKGPSSIHPLFVRRPLLVGSTGAQLARLTVGRLRRIRQIPILRGSSVSAPATLALTVGDSWMGPDSYIGPVRPVAMGHGREGCLRSASDILASFEMAAPRLSLPTERHGSISVDADNKPLLRAHDHDVLR